MDTDNDSASRTYLFPARKYFWLLIALWTGCIAASSGWNLSQLRKETREHARTIARVAFEKDVSYRIWNARHGGVYATVTADTQPNPYLKVAEREITTPSGKLLTLINPAFMTRQVHELVQEKYGIRGHITSLNPIRPQNRPDAWERIALKAVAGGALEYSSIERMDGADQMRLMKPLITEQGCLKCHAEQGYQLNDIRGGISVAVPMAPLRRMERSRMLNLSVAHGLLWLFGVFGIAFGIRRLAVQDERRTMVENSLRESEERYRTLFDSAGEAIFLMENGMMTECNPQAALLFGYQPEEIVGKAPAQLSPPTQPDGRDSVDKAREKVSAALADKTQTFEWVHRRKNGETFDAEVTLNRVYLRNKLLLQAIVRDISLRKKAEEEKALRERLQGVVETAGAVCHELGQPLQIISGNTELLLATCTDASDEKNCQRFEVINREIQRMRDITHKLMMTTRYETKRYTEETDIIDINKAAEEEPEDR